MKRSAFGDPQPANADEMQQAINEKGFAPDEIYVDVSFVSDNGEPWDGWNAEARESENGEEVFNTVGYASKDALLADLKACGLTNIDFLED